MSNTWTIERDKMTKTETTTGWLVRTWFPWTQTFGLSEKSAWQRLRDEDSKPLDTFKEYVKDKKERGYICIKVIRKRSFREGWDD